VNSFDRLFPHLFLIPLLLVTVGVLVVLFFGAMGEDARSLSDIIRDMHAGSDHSRWQDAEALAKRVNQLAEAGTLKPLSEAETGLLVGLLERFPDDPKLGQFVVTALARAGQPAKTLPALRRLAAADATPVEVRIAAMEGLGVLGGGGEVALLISVLERVKDPEQWELRLYAIHALTTAHGSAPGTPAVVEAIRKHVSDPRREVSWHAAYYLAYYFNDSSGAGVLRRLLEWEFLDRERGDRNRPLTHAEREDWMVKALQGLYRLEKDGILDQLRQARDQARARNYLKVVDAAERILQESRARPRETP
jgi:hypothetical protein